MAAIACRAACHRSSATRARQVFRSNCATLVACLSYLVSCAPARDDRAFAAHDSAGIGIVAVGEASIAALPTIKLDSAALIIGDSDRGEDYEFHLARQPWLLADGRIAVANAQREIRFYDSTGRFLSRVGRKGKGPGEFEQLWTLSRLRGDTLLAQDPANARVTLFMPNGQLLRSYNLVAAFAVPPGMEWLGDGSGVYFDSNIGRIVSEQQAQTAGVRRDSSWLLRVSAEGQTRDSIARLSGRWVHVQGGWVGYVRLAGDLILAAGDDFFVTGHGESFALTWHDASGMPSHHVRVTLPKKPVTDREIAAFNSATQVRAPREAVRANLVSFAKFLPEVAEARVDRSGNAWVRRWAPPDARDAEWIVFDRAARPIARALLPAALRPNDIARDYVLGVFQDDDGVQTIRRYSMTR